MSKKGQTYTSFLSGKTVKLTDQIGKGGAGSIHKVYRKPRLVAKVLFNATKDDEQRIKEMVNDHKKGKIKLDLPWNKGMTTKLGTWPIDLLFDANKKFKGFLMPKASGIELQHITSNNFNKHPKYQSFSKIKNKLILCQRLAIVFSNFYKSGNYSNGDIKPQNIYVDDKGFPMILDLDNLTINNISPKSKQGTPGYMAHDYKDDIYTDYFSIAVIFYELIFGIHPYMGSSKNDKIVETQDKIKHRMFVHGRKKRNFHFIPPPHDAFNKVINKDLQMLFHQAFDLDEPKKRPNMEVWAKTLGSFILSKNIFKDTYKPNQPASPKPRKSKRSSYKTTTKSTPKGGNLFGTRKRKSTASTAFAPPQTHPALFKKYPRQYWISIGVMIFCIFYGVNENSDVFTATLGSFGIWCLYYYLYWRKKVLKDFGPLWKQYFTIGSLFKSTKTTPSIKNRGGLDFFASGLIFLTLGWVFIDVDDVERWLFHYYFDEEDLIILIPLLSLISFIYYWPLKKIYQVSNVIFLRFLQILRLLIFWILLVLYGVTTFNYFDIYYLRENNDSFYNDYSTSDAIEEVEPATNDNFKSKKGSSKSSPSVFMKFKQQNKVVHQDVVFKGGFIDYRKGWNHTDSLIVISKSNNIKRHFLVEEGKDYKTEANISFNSTEGYGWFEAKRDIYLSLDDFGYSQITEKPGWQTWQVQRLGLGDEIIVRAEDITYNEEDNDYGIYFIQNNIESFIRFMSDDIWEEEFVSQETLDKIFNQKTANDKHTHIVLKGETCYGIAKRYKIKLKDLYRMNPKAKKKIYPGMKLIIHDELIKEQKKTKKEDNKDLNYVELNIQLITKEGKKIINEPIYLRSINESGTITKTKNYKSSNSGYLTLSVIPGEKYTISSQNKIFKLFEINIPSWVVGEYEIDVSDKIQLLNKNSNNIADLKYDFSKSLFISNISGYNSKGFTETKRRKINYIETCISPTAYPDKDLPQAPKGTYKLYVRIIDPNGDLLKINSSSSRSMMNDKRYLIFENSSAFGRNGIQVSGLSNDISLPVKSDICILYFFKNNVDFGIEIDEKINLIPGEYKISVYIKKSDDYFAHFISEDYFMAK